MLGGLLGILGAAVVALVVTTLYQRGHGHRMGAISSAHPSSGWNTGLCISPVGTTLSPSVPGHVEEQLWLGE